MQTESKNDPEDRERTKDAGRKRRVLKVGAIAGAVVLLIGIVWWIYSSHYESTDDAFVEGDIIPVSARVSGTVEQVLVNDNQDVDVGQVLAIIDPRDIQTRLDAAAAGLSVAQAELESAKAAQLGADADVSAAQAEESMRTSDLERYRAADPRAVSRQQLDTSSAMAKSAQAELRSAQTRAASARARIGEAEAKVKQAEAAMEQAKLDLSYTEVKAPAAGKVTRKSVQPGQYLAVGQMLLSLVSKNMWVVANFKETQLAKLRRGQSVSIEIDALPGRTFSGRVDSIQAGSGARFSLLPPENATGNYVKVVQRVPVKIVFTDPAKDDYIFGPGMSAVPTVNLNSGGDEPLSRAPGKRADIR